jgi:N-acetylmuramoyl-L-alanine amidase
VTPPSDALIGTINSSASGSRAVYTLTPAAGSKIDGYYIETVPEGLRLNIKRRPVAQMGGSPLSGFTIVVDAGHGGDDTGAHSPWGADFAESYINLYAALKLRSVLTHMGADVILTRSSDAAATLQSRLTASRTARPDLFVSLHCNSMAEDVNSDSIRGAAVFYRESGSAEFSRHIYNYLLEVLGIQGRGVHQANFYVCRGYWTPSALIEMGFINNPFDYEWLIDDGEQNRLILAIADGIVEFFR